ncbi:MAG: protein translocase subunit SecD [Verrucomicrobiae bacterium]|nr:protein translocase subunit SecD [Verrucomicrobiae bacterium]
MKILAQTATPAPKSGTENATPAAKTEAAAPAAKPEAKTETPAAPVADKPAPAEAKQDAAVEKPAPAPAAPATDAPAPATTDATTTTATMEVPAGSDAVAKEADAAGAAGLPSQVIFGLGVLLMGMFLWYFGTESSRRKRLIGTVLAIAVAAGSWWFYDSLGIKKGIEIQGGIAMTIRIDPGEDEDGNPKPVSPGAQQQAIKVLQRRLDNLGTQDITISPQGEDRIFLQLPGKDEKERKQIEETLAKVAKLEFSLVHPDSRFKAAQVAGGADVVAGWRALPYIPQEDDEGNPLPSRGYELVKIKPDMLGKHVTKAFHFYGPEGDAISVSFDGEGAKIMAALTSQHQNEQLAIIMDDEILSAPNIKQPFSSGCQITGNFTQESATALASALENPLENPIKIERSSVISPTMGAQTIHQGVFAGVAGLALTLLFILVYYRFAGLLAMVGLTLNLAMIFGAMALFKFTLTLPGIAGIILTIGIAVDANVLIYERLREEMAAGKSLPAAIKTAFEKALSAIIDANITTLFTAIILFAVATGTVRGFAVTLMIGIIATLFSALIVTRVCFSWMTDTGFLQSLKFLNIIPSKIIDFLGKRKIAILCSAVAFVVSLVVIFVSDPRGVDLKEGDLVTFRAPDTLEKGQVAELLQDADLDLQPIVQIQKPVGTDGEFVTVRTGFEKGDTVIEKLQEKFGELEDLTKDSVGSAVGSEMLRSSVIALGLGLLVILVYLTIRFEFAFALGAIAALFHDLVITLGITTLLGEEVSLITVGAFLTIAGYSINDTIIVFDRVREGLATKRGDVKDVMNHALNATLGRTLLTSGTTLFTVVVLYLFGGPALKGFSLPLIIGILVGTYSSIFVASPIVLWWARRTGTNLRREVLDTEASRVDSGTAKA